MENGQAGEHTGSNLRYTAEPYTAFHHHHAAPAYRGVGRTEDYEGRAADLYSDGVVKMGGLNLGSKPPAAPGLPGSQGFGLGQPELGHEHAAAAGLVRTPQPPAFGPGAGRYGQAFDRGYAPAPAPPPRGDFGYARGGYGGGGGGGGRFGGGGRGYGAFPYGPPPPGAPPPPMGGGVATPLMPPRNDGPPPERPQHGQVGQGYRKLWQQVTKVSRGQKLGDGAEKVPFSDMTVEDLLRIVRSLPPEESAVAAVSRGLYYLDSRALAALLKELHKVGLSNRASELFDWLRSLADTHELCHLCDVYTYTTIISQCGSHQQLRKALELVAEMRGRGIQCNVHTYSALMNVCIKANELELALDVYGQLLREGCTPNLVTYNILIDVHGKTGAWQEAVQVLDALESQGTKPEVRTYNTIINACNRSGHPEHALRVYERMLADGAQPTATTYTALISAYGKTGKVDEALQIFRDMVARGCERNVITYSSLISACEKAGRWQLALDFFDEMHRDSCKPNVVTFNALIAACGQAGQWRHSVDIFEQMQALGCKPDAVTYGALLTAFDKGNQWTRALQAMEDMLAQGHRPDGAGYCAAIEALVRSGVEPAYHKAAQLFQAAARQGQLRLMPQGGPDHGCIAFTVGSAAMATLQWLLELRGRHQAAAASAKAGAGAGAPGTTSPYGAPPVLAPQPLPPQDNPGLVLLKGKAGRSEAPPGAVGEALTAMLARLPATITIVPQGVRVEVEAPPLPQPPGSASPGPGAGASPGAGSGPPPSSTAASWLDGPALEALLAPLGAAPKRKLPADALAAEDAACAARCAKAFAAVKEFEETHPLGGGGRGPGEAAARKDAVARLVGLGRALGLHEESIHDSVQLLDRLLGLGPVEVDSPLLAAVASFSAKQGEREELAEDAVERAAACATGSLKDAQQRLHAALQGDVGSISALRILHLYLERLGCDFQEAGAVERMAGEALSVMAESVFSAAFLAFPPSLVAAAVLTSARHAAGAWPYWPATLAALTGFEDPAANGFGRAVECADALTSQRRGGRPFTPAKEPPSSQQGSAVKASASGKHLLNAGSGPIGPPGTLGSPTLPPGGSVPGTPPDRLLGRGGGGANNALGTPLSAPLGTPLGGSSTVASTPPASLGYSAGNGEDVSPSQAFT